VKTAEEVATDLTTMLIEMFNKDEKLQKKFSVHCSSLMVANFGLSALKAIENNKLKLTLEVKFC